MEIKKGDTIKILNGKDSGKTGKVLHAYPKEGRVVVESLNLFKKRVRPKKAGQKGEIVSVPRPLCVSRVMIVCGNCKKAVRTGHRTEGNQKVRFCRKCNSII